ncbi:putative holin-like toxin [Aquibacillus rhizosphaerae]|uniref:putative holin-like toxin n=1 Tax=Aquibacillus rhizosphaerae TaxID=3051431 RepID=UPI002F3EF1E0
MFSFGTFLIALLALVVSLINKKFTHKSLGEVYPQKRIADSSGEPLNNRYSS